MKNKGSTLISTNGVGVHTRKTYTKFESNLCSGLREDVEKCVEQRSLNKIVNIGHSDQN